jgi:hypothetical protein
MLMLHMPAGQIATGEHSTSRGGLAGRRVKNLGEECGEMNGFDRAAETIDGACGGNDVGATRQCKFGDALADAARTSRDQPIAARL